MPKEAVREQERPVTSYLEVLRDMRGGKTIMDLSSRLTEVVEAVQSTAKKGSITIMLEVRPAHKGDVIDQFMITESIKHVVPEKDKPDTLFIMNHEGIMQSFSSRQTQLEFKEINRMFEGEIKEVK